MMIQKMLGHLTAIHYPVVLQQVSEPTTRTVFSIVWFSHDFCLIFTLQDLIGGMTEIEDRYWIEADSFIRSGLPNKTDTTSGMKRFSYPYIKAPHSQNPNKSSLLRFVLFTPSQTFCGKLDHLSATQYSDLLVPYNPVLDISSKKITFSPALNF